MITKENYVSTRNACKLCSPLGASLAFKGVKGCLSLLHGSQGCATYIRRYMISHFKEPMDIASSNFSESSAIFGGRQNLHDALTNLISQYKPEMIGVASTCLSETIGDDVPFFIKEFYKQNSEYTLPEIVSVSTPSYQGTHTEGYWRTVKALVTSLAESGKRHSLNVFSGMISPADIQYLKDVMQDFNVNYTLLPDYSVSLNGCSWSEYKKIPEGGTSIEEIRYTGSAMHSLEVGNVCYPEISPALWLEEKMQIKASRLPMPIGVRACDQFFKELSKVTNTEIPEKYELARGQLIDGYADGHKYVFGKKAVVYGEPDLVLSVTSFLTEIGITPVICATGAVSKVYKKEMAEILKDIPEGDVHLLEDVDFERIAELSREVQPDIIIGHSKGYYIARELEIPIVRIGFPVHDRLGGQRILHIGYEGTVRLFDEIANALIQYKQDNSPVGYKYM